MEDYKKKSLYITQYITKYTNKIKFVNENIIDIVLIYFIENYIIDNIT